MAKPAHQGELGGNVGALLGRARRSRPNTEFQEKDPGETRAWEMQERMARGGELLLSMGVVRPPWGSGAVE